ncbi:HDOD domain-containing protein [Desulfogranum mediterraneum]|uniref:HDOD domain-containing protein n=1 Tax=Desulfogranum mediterraneum TaxID=160661 RepID=UPI000428CF52|nr:HDOD domain-containing protein [Desulfogranum mediterraneum]
MTKSRAFVDTLSEYIESERLTLPIFDPVAMRVQLELIKKDPDLRTVERIIIADQSLSSNILKVANSSRFGGLVKTTTVRSAIVRLGMTEIGNIVLMDMNRKNYQSKDPKVRVMMRRLWQHSVGCAFAAGWLSKRLDFGVMQNEAFFSGLFHDVGKLLILVVIEQKRKKNKTIKIDNDLLLQAMELMHPEQGYRLMQQLGLPEASCNIARDHHQQEPNPDNYLLLLVRMANLVCHQLGIGLVRDGELELPATAEARLLNLAAEDIQELAEFLESTPSLGN